MTPEPRLVCGMTESPPIIRYSGSVGTFVTDEMFTDARTARSATGERSGIGTIGPGAAPVRVKATAGFGAAKLDCVADNRPDSTSPPTTPTPTQSPSTNTLGTFMKLS